MPPPHGTRANLQEGIRPLAQVYESADTNTKALHQTPTIEVHATLNQEQGDTGYQPGMCFRCGGGRHSAANCRFRNAECYHCGKRGHNVRACRNWAKSVEKAKTGRLPVQSGRSQQSYHVSSTEEEAPVSPEKLEDA